MSKNYQNFITRSDIFAFVFFLAFILITFIFDYFIVLDYVLIKQSNNGSILFDQSWKKYLHSLAAFFILHNVLGNLYKVIQVDSSIRNIMLFQSEKSTNLWKFCSICECLTPPRSFHCRNCKICILKRTHHCMFVNACVGYKNFRYFYLLLVYVMIGCLYTTYLNMNYVWDVLGGLTVHNFFAHAFPFLFWLLGKMSISSTLICLISIVNICGVLFSAGLLAYHGQLMINNQTVFERNKHINIYNTGNIFQTIEEAFGKNWKLTWASPFIESELMSDGINFQTVKNYGPKQSTFKNK